MSEAHLSKPFPPPRPASMASNFADSAINMDVDSDPDTPIASPGTKSLPLDILPTTSSRLFERLTRLAATAWEYEQDGQLHEAVVGNMHKALDGFESQMNGERASSVHSQPSQVHQEAQQSQNSAFEAESADILTHLTTSVSSIRLRHQEHRHLLELSTVRLEAVAQRCLAQERAMQELDNEIQALRNENNVLGKENEDLHVQLQELESESRGKDVAMQAMTGAVTGLEGWIANTLPLARQNRTPRRHTRQREVVRGKGRFRGRYLVEDDDDYEESGTYSWGGRFEMTAADVREGVMGWVRGFKDVEEGLRASGRKKPPGPSAIGEVTEEEWGDFEGGT